MKANIVICASLLLAVFNLVHVVTLSRPVHDSAADDACRKVGGTCQYDIFYCDGSYVSARCFGPSFRRCCVAARSDVPCINRGGKCQVDRFRCKGKYQTGLCAGGRSKRCCVP